MSADFPRFSPYLAYFPACPSRRPGMLGGAVRWLSRPDEIPAAGILTGMPGMGTHPGEPSG